MTRHPSNSDSGIEEERQHFAETLTLQWEDGFWNGVLQESWEGYRTRVKLRTDHDSNLVERIADDVERTPEETSSTNEDLNDTMTLDWDEGFWEGTLSDAFEGHRGRINLSEVEDCRKRRSSGGLVLLAQRCTYILQENPKRREEIERLLRPFMLKLRLVENKVVLEESFVPLQSPTSPPFLNKGSLYKYLETMAYSAADAMALIQRQRATSVAEMIQTCLDRDATLIQKPRLRRACVESLLLLYKHYEALPTSIRLDLDNVKTGPTTMPCAWGAFSDVWKESWNNQTVALKVLRIYPNNEASVSNALSVSDLVWRQLHHRNILPLLGINTTVFHPRTCLVSPWMSNGNLVSFLREVDCSLKDKIRMLRDVAEGVRYLHEHEPPIVHGDIKGTNILVTDEQVCCIADFGLCEIQDDRLNEELAMIGQSSSITVGTTRWLAPELIRQQSRRKTSSDIYAFGCTIFEIIAGKTPFHEKRHDAAAIVAILSGERPKRTEAFPDWTWSLVEECWSENVIARPKANEVLLRLDEGLLSNEVLLRLDEGLLSSGGESNSGFLPPAAIPLLSDRPQIKITCDHSPDARNIIVCIDTLLEVFDRHSNILELFRRLIKDEKRQQVFYHSGVDTHVRSNWNPLTNYKRATDLVFAWSFEKVLLRAYHWLCRVYRSGDRIFLFGFSREAAQVRALSGMIEKVGLLRDAGNEEMGKFAYDLYCHSTDRPDPTPPEHRSETMPPRFKEAFSRSVMVHFVGAWDTVSSISLIRGARHLPLTASGMKHVCFFRHALALHERRVKYLPEFAYGGDCSQLVESLPDEIPHIKEVWFAGTHTDLGGRNPDGKLLDPALQWMLDEASEVGVLLASLAGDQRADRIVRVSKPMSIPWILFEVLPLKMRSYAQSEKNRQGVTRRPHFAQRRPVLPGQPIHRSVFRHTSSANRKHLPSLPERFVIEPDRHIEGVGSGSDESLIIL